MLEQYNITIFTSKHLTSLPNETYTTSSFPAPWDTMFKIDNSHKFQIMLSVPAEGYHPSN